MKKVSIAINVIMGLMIVLLLYRINKTDNRFLEIQKHLSSQDSLKVKNFELKKSKEISKIDFTRAKIMSNKFKNNQSPFESECITEILYNPIKFGFKEKTITKYLIEVDTVNFKFYNQSPRTKEWIKLEIREKSDIRDVLYLLVLKPWPTKILKPNEDPNTAKDLRERK